MTSSSFDISLNNHVDFVGAETQYKLPQISENPSFIAQISF
jgi:hypothetical protein